MLLLCPNWHASASNNASHNLTTLFIRPHFHGPMVFAIKAGFYLKLSEILRGLEKG